MYKSKNKADLIIEVWEDLDCESVGEKEIVSIERAVEKRFGPAAVESPMVIARRLADEGADLRHSEIMKLYIKRHSRRPHEAMFRNVFKFETLRAAETSLRNLEALRNKLEKDRDKTALRLLGEKAVEAKENCLRRSTSPKLDAAGRQVQAEVAEWLALWLKSPQIFAQWLKLRKQSATFKKKLF